MAAPLGAGVPAGSERAGRADESCGSGRPVLQREGKTMDSLPVQQASMWVISADYPLVTKLEARF